MAGKYRRVVDDGVPTRRTTIYLDPELKETLREEAARQKRSLSSLVDLILDEWAESKSATAGADERAPSKRRGA